MGPIDRPSLTLRVDLLNTTIGLPTDDRLLQTLDTTPDIKAQGSHLMLTDQFVKGTAGTISGRYRIGYVRHEWAFKPFKLLDLDGQFPGFFTAFSDLSQNEAVQSALGQSATNIDGSINSVILPAMNVTWNGVEIGFMAEMGSRRVALDRHGSYVQFVTGGFEIFGGLHHVQTRTHSTPATTTDKFGYHIGLGIELGLMQFHIGQIGMTLSPGVARGALAMYGVEDDIVAVVASAHIHVVDVGLRF